MTADVRNDREEPRTLHGGGELALVTRAHATEPARQDLAVIRDEAAERAVILVVDEPNARLAERAGFLSSAHVSPHPRRLPRGDAQRAVLPRTSAAHRPRFRAA